VEWVTTGVALTIIASREFAEVKEMTIPSYTLKDFAPMQTSYSSSKI